MSDRIERLEIPVGGFVFDALADGPGDGELVLLLHGFPESSHQWRHVLSALAGAGYRAVAPDQRGYSPRARPARVEDYAVDHLVADVLAVADGMGGHTFHLVGHDWGAAVAWAVAGRYPERLRTLTILSVPHPRAFGDALRDDPDQQQKSGYIAVFRAEGGVAERALLDDDAAGLRTMFAASGLADHDEYVRRMREPGALTAALNWYRAMEPGLVGDLGPITTPTLFVWGDRDLALGRRAAEATAGFVDGPYRFVPLEGVGHWIAEEVPERLNGLLLDHLAAAPNEIG